MSKFTMFFIGLACVLFVFGFAYSYDHISKNGSSTEEQYYAQGQQIMCKRMSVTACGARLYDCEIAIEYRCAHNVVVIKGASNVP